MLYELGMLKMLHDSIACAFLDRFFVFITWLGNGGMIWILLCIVLLVKPETRKTGVSMVFALIIAASATYVLKLAVARPRPFLLDRGIELLITAPADYSFPSGHTASSFAAAWTLKEKPKLFIPSFLLASLIAFSRMYLLVHYPSDVAAGMLIGIFCGQIEIWCGSFALWCIRRYRKQRRKKCINQ